MSKIPESLQTFVQDKLGWVATAAADGTPNVTPKGTIRVLDDQTLVFADLFSMKTRENLLANPKAAVTVADPEKAQAYQFKGSVELVDSGEVYDRVAAQLKASGKPLPDPAYAAIIHVEAVFNQSPGPDAGKRLDA